MNWLPRVPPGPPLSTPVRGDPTPTQSSQSGDEGCTSNAAARGCVVALLKDLSLFALALQFPKVVNKKKKETFLKAGSLAKCLN